MPLLCYDCNRQTISKLDGNKICFRVCIFTDRPDKLCYNKQLYKDG